MGTWGNWILAPFGEDRAGAEHLLADDGFQVQGETASGGWIFGEGAREPRSDLDESVGRFAADLGAAVGWFVVDSDFSCIVAADREAIVSRLILKENSAREGWDWDVPDEWRHPDRFRRFSEWSSLAQSPVEAARVEEILSADWVFADEGVWELLETVGLALPYEEEPAESRPAWMAAPATLEDVGVAALEGYRAPLAWMSSLGSRVGGEVVSWSAMRFLPGRGNDFIGIWDRGSPDAPIARFPLSPRGAQKAMDAHRELQEPDVLSQMRVDELGGYSGRLDLQGETVRVCGRDLAWSHSRYVLGRTDHAIGIWDREHPTEPIERFALDDAGERAGSSRIHELLAPMLLAGKMLNGTRRFAGSGSGAMPLGPVELHAWVEFEPTVWLVTEEDPDPLWGRSGDAPLHVYSVQTAPGTPGIELRGTFASQEEMQQGGAAWNLPTSWNDVPESVRRTLLDTARWVAEQGRIE
jgi:hypothetical protein